MHSARVWLTQRTFAQRDVIRQGIGFRDRHRHVLSNGSVRRDAERSVVETQIFMARTTRIAITTVQVGLDCNSAPNRYVRSFFPVPLSNVASQCHNLARKLVTGDDRIAGQWRIAINNMQIGAADTTCTHSNEHFIWTRSGVWHIVHPNDARSINDHSTHRRLILSFLGYDNR